jgi:hypothetical protein
MAPACPPGRVDDRASSSGPAALGTLTGLPLPPTGRSGLPRATRTSSSRCTTNELIGELRVRLVVSGRSPWRAPHPSARFSGAWPPSVGDPVQEGVRNLLGQGGRGRLGHATEQGFRDPSLDAEPACLGPYKEEAGGSSPSAPTRKP